MVKSDDKPTFYLLHCGTYKPINLFTVGSYNTTILSLIIKREGIQMEDAEQSFVVIIDEMKIKSGLIFNKNTGELVGFTNLGQVNQDISKIVVL